MWSAGSCRDPPGTGGGVVATVEVPLMTKLRMTRMARVSVIAVTLALVVAAPAAAAQPTRTVNHDLRPWVLPAGTACAFDVIATQVKGFATQTTFSDGANMY